MTSFARPNKDDYPGAAKKHLDDAAALLAAKRFDGAGYLLGYVIECSLRTVVMLGEIVTRGNVAPALWRRELDPSSQTMRRLASVASREARAIGRGHDLGALADATTGYRHVLNSSNATYAPPFDTAKSPFGGEDSWTESIRYRAEGDVDELKAEEWLQIVEKVYEATVAKMIRDGLIRR